jgi:hypothetical protein
MKTPGVLWFASIALAGVLGCGAFVEIASFLKLAPEQDLRANRTDGHWSSFDQLAVFFGGVPAICLVRFGLFRILKWAPYDKANNEQG